MIKLMLISDLHYGFDEKTSNKHLKFWKYASQAIKRENVKAVILAGDLASTRQRQFFKCLELASNSVTVPILMVRGNHDHWCGEDDKDRERKREGVPSLERMFYNHDIYTKILGIHHLEKGPFVIDDVIICGFDGWYATPHPPTNDHQWMPTTIEGQPFVSGYLVTKAWRDFQACLDVDTSGHRKSVLVTHMNPYAFSPFKGWEPKTVDELLADGITHVGMSANLKFLPEIRDKFDVLCCGHTHEYKNDTKEGIQIYNCGADYNLPKYLIFEI